MLRRVGTHLRNQWMGALALFVALGGTAYAAATIGSAEIIDGSILSADVKNGQVTRDDLADNAVRTGKVLDESLTGHDIQNNTIGGADVNESLLDPLTHAQIKDESLTGHDIQDDTIGGADVNESLLDGVSYSPAFAYHLPFFELPSGPQLTDMGPETQVIYTGDGTHGDPFVHVRAPGVVMAFATLNFVQAANHPSATIGCDLGLVRPGDSTANGFGAGVTERLDPQEGREVIPLVGAKVVNTPGDYYVNVACRASGAPRFTTGSIVAWAT